MTDYRRPRIPGSIWFFTVALAERRGNRSLVEHIEALRRAFADTKARMPFGIDAAVVMPDHLHCLWTLPPGDTDYSIRWSLIKGRFSRSIAKGERICESRAKRRERGIWQRRFWEHAIRDQDDYNRHVDYIHWNPVKHGWVQRVADWPHSSFHRYVAQGVHPLDWASDGDFGVRGGE